MRNKILAVAMAAAGVAFSGMSMAATTQGSVGATSTGTVDITMTVPKLIRITNLATITITPTYTATGFDPASGSSDACVRQNGAGAKYGIVATSANGSFALKSGALATVPYSLKWGGAGLTYNTNLAAQTPESTSLGSCTATAGKLAVDITAADMNAAEGSATPYTDTVTLVVTPE